jgi:hypothetical protein
MRTWSSWNSQGPASLVAWSLRRKWIDLGVGLEFGVESENVQS